MPSRLNRRLLAAVWLVAAAPATSYAQSADAFNPGSDTLTIDALAIQPDGKILVGGAFTAIGGGFPGNTPRPNAITSAGFCLTVRWTPPSIRAPTAASRR